MAEVEVGNGGLGDLSHVSVVEKEERREEDGGEGRGPRDELRYSVQRYVKSGDDFIFDVQVRVRSYARCCSCIISCFAASALLHQRSPPLPSPRQVEVNGKEKLVRRSYRDLLWLHRSLSRRVELGGFIVSPARTSAACRPCLGSQYCSQTCWELAFLYVHYWLRECETT